jgi:hypothetical protein
MSLGLILLIILVLALVGALPGPIVESGVMVLPAA